jgi:uncharacterized ion transporter superfamily protein YfcC
MGRGALLIGIVGDMKEEQLTTTFVDGARDLRGVDLIIGIAGSITVVALLARLAVLTVVVFTLGAFV